MEEKKFNFKMVKSIIKLGIILIIIIAVVLPIMVYSVLKNDNDLWKKSKDEFEVVQEENPLEEDLYYEEGNSNSNNTTTQTLQTSSSGNTIILTNNNNEQSNQENRNVIGITENTLSTGYCYGANLDERLNNIVEINEKEVQEYLEKAFGTDKAEQKKYLKAFLKAEYATLFPDLRTKDKIGTIFEENELQGAIQIKRATTDGETASAEASEILEYKPYREFKEMMNAKNRDVLNYFTLDVEKTTNDDGEESSIIKLIVASMNEIVTDKETNDELVLKEWQKEGYQFSDESTNSDTKTAQKIETSFSEVSTTASSFFFAGITYSLLLLD